MNYVPRLTDAGMCVPGTTVWNWYSGNENPFSTPGLRMPNCTTYCCGRYAEIRGAFHAMPPGNAGQWFVPATLDSLGFTYGQGATSSPQLGAIMVWKDEAPSGTYPGHVAIVEKIDRLESGLIQITTSNSGYSAWNGGDRPPYPVKLGEIDPSTGKRMMTTGFYTQKVNNGNDYSITYHAGHPYTFQGFIYNDATVATTNACVVAAICGNFYQESTVNPGVYQGLTPFDPYNTTGQGFGLGQWTNTTGSYRLRAMFEWGAENGVDVTNGPGQLEYMLVEASWVPGRGTPNYNYSSLDEFMASPETDIDKLTYDFCAGWEQNPDAYPSIVNMPNRQAFARAAYAYIVDHADDDPEWYDWINTNEYLNYFDTTLEEISGDVANNVMCLYFYLSGVTPEPIPERSRKGMPVWMMTKKKLYRRRFMF